MEGNVAAYTLIYRFLKQQSQNKAAQAVKKAATPFVILRDDVEQQGPPLEDIIKEWRALKNTKSGDVDSSSAESESSDDSSSDEEDSSDSSSSSEDTSGSKDEGGDTSDSDDSSDDSDEETKTKKAPQRGAERDTSATLSSENSQELAKLILNVPEKLAKAKNKESESDSSDSDSDSDCSGSDSSDAEASSGSSDSSSGSKPSDEEANAKDKAPPNKEKTTKDESSSSSESSSDSEDESDSAPQQKEDRHVAKRRKTSENGAAAVTAVAIEITRTSQRKENPPPRVDERFQRVKMHNLPPDSILNNGFEARGGATNDYGQRAHRDLIVTRGAGFRKEKNKKKRGSYRGGEITMECHSIKFDF